MAIPGNVVEKVGDSARVATQNGASLTRDPNGHWYDVMTNTGSGLADHVGGGDAQYIATHAVPAAAIVDSSVRIAQALGRDWSSADFDGVRDAMSQQASTVAQEAASVWNGTTPDGKPLSTFQRVGAAFGLITSVEQLITAPLGMIPFPALPAVRILDMDIGLPHAHMHPPNLTPPNPVPVPLPSTGPVIPIPFLSGASKTVINGMPAARCGDMGLGIWCGGYFPMYEIFLGSSNVWIEGSRAARVGVDITKHCIFSAPKPNDPPLGPMFGTTICCSPNVVIGGIPLPSLTSMAFGAAFKALFKGAGKLLGALRKRIGKGAANAAPSPRAAGSSGPAPRGATPPPPPHMRVPEIRSPRVAVLARDVAPGGRQVVTDFTAGELRALTAITGHEWAVIVQRDGRLAVVHGTPTQIPLRTGDHMLVHTHPPGDVAMPSTPTRCADPNAVDTLNAVDNRQMYGWDHPQAVIGQDGNVRFFNEHGVINNPRQQYLPINQDGNITGMHHRGGNPESGGQAIPPAMMYPGYGPWP